MAYSIGIDFGTSNTVIAVTDDAGRAAAVRFQHGEDVQTTFPTALCFWEEEEHRHGRTLKVEGGPWAIEQFLKGEDQHRFIQSFKSFAASSAFRETRIFSKTYKFEDLLAVFMQTLLKHWHMEGVPQRIVIGRPVTFAGPSPNDALAMERYRAGFGRLGWDSAHYVYEPVGAAFYYAQGLQADATVLIADFGGGTSDFSILRFERRNGQLAARPLAHTGIGIAGDTFDYRIIDKVVSPRLGKGGSYKSFDKVLTIPNGFYTNFARWNFLAMMKSSGELRELNKLVKEAVDPEPLRKFIALIEHDLGYALYRAVSKTKVELSSADKALFDFNEEGLSIRGYIRRSDFERWISPDVERINDTVSAALKAAGLAEPAIDMVFLTGGSSFIPLLRERFDDRFGATKIATGDQFGSIANGLALLGLSDNLHDWAVKG